MERVYAFLKEAGVFYLATIEKDQPHIFPCSTIDLFEDNLYIHTGHNLDNYYHMKERPKIEICAIIGNNWIRITATAVESTSVAAEEHMLEAYPNLKSRYHAGDGNNVVMCLTEATATFSSFAKLPMVVHFGGTVHS